MTFCGRSRVTEEARLPRRTKRRHLGTRKLLENEVRESLNNSSILRKVLVFGLGFGLE